jgi:serine/threonine protein kinase
MSFFESFKPGDLIDGQYLVLKLLGKGGMGIVYKVKEFPSQNRLFALKILLPEGIPTFQIKKADLNDLRKRFLHEANSCMDLDHPNIVKVKGVQVFENKVYLLMEYIDGKNLSRWLEEHSTGFMEERWQIISDTCNALQYAHEQQIYHRDIKPTNIMVTDSGLSRIVDFGLAKPMEQELGERSKLGGLGSQRYAAPEQWRGGFYDHRVDIYSLGIVCIEILIGRYPENPIRPKILEELRERTSEQISMVLRKAAEIAPSDRYGNIKDMYKDLVNAQQPTSIRSPIAPTFEKRDAPIAGIPPARPSEPTIETIDDRRTTEKTHSKPTISRNKIGFILALLGTSVIVASAVFLVKSSFEARGTGTRIGEFKIISLDTGEFLHPARSTFVLTSGERILIHVEMDTQPDDQPLEVFFDAVFGAINAEGKLSAQYRAPPLLHSKDIIIIEASNGVEIYRQALGVEIQAEDEQMESPPPGIDERYDQQQWKGDLVQ